MTEAIATAPSTPRRSRRVRRPSGEPPPLARPFGRIDRWVLVAGLLTLTMWIVFAATRGNLVWAVDKVDRNLMRPLIAIRTPALTHVARAIDELTSGLAIHLIRWGTFIALVCVKRFRHLIVYLAALATAAFVSQTLVDVFQRPRPYGIEILGDWDGFAHPSLPIVALTGSLAGVCLTLVPRGRLRHRVEAGFVAVLALVGLSRVYLATDHPSDVLFAGLLSAMVMVVFFRVLAPEPAFPVVYKRGRSAHLTLDEPRLEAIRVAVAEQLGFEVTGVKPVGLAGSAGSTPVRLTVTDQPPGRIFAKIYAKTHLRSDRWYKLGREILYGRMEDETSFRSVRQLVEYEDYLMRVMRDSGVPVVSTYGIVEMSPEREYLLVTDFLDGGVEVGDPELEVDDDLIDQGLVAIRALWDGGLAHRDVKPANIMVLDHRIALIDVAFGEVRPSAWRQAVDLANMMLVLALRTDAERVYARALERFTPDDIGEAFAATRGLTVPSQLRSMMKADGRDLITEFRALAPPHTPIRIQRWSVRRVGLLMGAGFAGLLLASYVVANLLTVPS
jgi:tRNA A-37 threonylcarbamoyl transferase component Bud32/membrane-associated phospholipid phosphatase